ncbi:MAG: M20 family metallopeptidase [bacterium]
MSDRGVIDSGSLKRLLKRLIDIYSPTGKEEEILDYLYEYLTSQGLAVRKQSVDEGRYNLIVAPEREIHLTFVGHLDTVIAYDLDNYGYDKKGDVITGLGAADMKGGCAAMIEVFIALWKKNVPPPPVALALVVGEEEDGDGAKVLTNSEFKSRWAVIGEPTDLMPCLNHYGYLEIQIITKGKRIHASMARHGMNPIEAMLKLIMHIAQYIETKRPRLVYNIRDLFTSQAGFFVPDHCEAWVDMHIPPDIPLQEIVREIEQLFERARPCDSPLEYTIRFHTTDAGYELSDQGPILEDLKDIFLRRSRAWKPVSFVSHSDGNRLWVSGMNPIILGPGQLDKAHAPDESISFRDIREAAEIYFELADSIKEYIR